MYFYIILLICQKNNKKKIEGDNYFIQYIFFSEGFHNVNVFIHEGTKYTCRWFISHNYNS